MKPRWRSLFWVYIASIVAIHGFVFRQSRHLIREGFPDFSIYYSAGWVARQGLSHQFYDDATRFEVQQQFASRVKQFGDPLPFTHPPFEAWYFAPFSGFSFLTAYILWDVTNVLLLAIGIWLIRPYLEHFPHFSILEGVLVSLAFFPIFFCLLQGQDALLIFFIYACAYVFLRRKCYLLAGFALALGLFKFHLIAAFVLLALFGRERRLWYGFVPASLVLGLVSFAMVGSQGFSNYPHFVLKLETEMSGSEKIPAGMPSLRGLLYLLSPSGWNTGPLLLIGCLVLVGYAAWRNSRSGSEDQFDLRFSLALITSALVGYHVVSYDLSMLLIPIALISNYVLRITHHSFSSKSLIVGMGILFFSPLQLFLSLQYKDFALMSLVLLLWSYGIASEMTSRRTAVQGI